ncbi:MAG: ABC transporter ATP-binding protein, partial [Planctomycetes bacterium]|nr:ABC transporter ATP-binding protein [Planctomycetota bacterium]
GKSTLLNLLGGLDAPDRGRVVIAGTDLADLGDDARTVFRRNHIGFVFQSFHLLPTLTVLENVLLPRELGGRARPQERERAELLLDRIGLVDRARSFPTALSGGEQQRVGIVRAIVGRPPLLLADEPTGNLDEDAARDVLAMLVDLAEESGSTVVIATHSHEAATRCGRVLRIDHGKLVEVDPTTRR